MTTVLTRTPSIVPGSNVRDAAGLRGNVRSTLREGDRLRAHVDWEGGFDTWVDADGLTRIEREGR